MTTKIVVDGYNLMLAGQGLDPARVADLEKARDSLLMKLAQYGRNTGHEMRVVFDGSHEGAPYGAKSRVAGVEVVFSGGHQKADDVIRAMVNNSRGDLIVVTSDRELADCAERGRCIALSSRQFMSRIEHATIAASERDGKDEDYHQTPSNRKRGNPRRLPKKERKRSSKIRKL